MRASFFSSDFFSSMVTIWGKFVTDVGMNVSVATFLTWGAGLVIVSMVEIAPAWIRSFLARARFLH